MLGANISSLKWLDALLVDFAPGDVSSGPKQNIHRFVQEGGMLVTPDIILAKKWLQFCDAADNGWIGQEKRCGLGIIGYEKALFEGRAFTKRLTPSRALHIPEIWLDENAASSVIALAMYIDLTGVARNLNGHRGSFAISYPSVADPALKQSYHDNAVISTKTLLFAYLPYTLVLILLALFAHFRSRLDWRWFALMIGIVVVCCLIYHHLSSKIRIGPAQVGSFNVIDFGQGKAIAHDGLILRTNKHGERRQTTCAANQTFWAGSAPEGTIEEAEGKIHHFTHDKLGSRSCVVVSYPKEEKDTEYQDIADFLPTNHIPYLSRTANDSSLPGSMKISGNGFIFQKALTGKLTDQMLYWPKLPTAKNFILLPSQGVLMPYRRIPLLPGEALLVWENERKPQYGFHEFKNNQTYYRMVILLTEFPGYRK